MCERSVGSKYCTPQKNIGPDNPTCQQLNKTQIQHRKRKREEKDIWKWKSRCRNKGEWDELSEMRWVRWVERDEGSEMSGERWVEWRELSQMWWVESDVVSWVRCGELDDMNPRCNLCLACFVWVFVVYVREVYMWVSVCIRGRWVNEWVWRSVCERV